MSLLAAMPPNIVQVNNALHVDELQREASHLAQRFLHVDLSKAKTQEQVLKALALACNFPAHFGKNLDALYDCLSDLKLENSSQTGFVIFLEALPHTAEFDASAAERLLNVFRDVADYFSAKKISFRLVYSLATSLQ
jgi:RNAse (barnase) inhibitor barstar